MQTFNNDDGKYYRFVTSWAEVSGGGAEILVDTKENILATTPTVDTIGFCTDTLQSLIWDSSAWQESSAYYDERTSYAGAVDDNNPNDVGKNYIANKHLSQVSLGSFDIEDRQGGIRSKYADDTEKLEVEHYDEDFGWERLLKGLKLQNLDADIVSNDFLHPISLLSGNSLEKDSQGIPQIQWGKTDVGAVQVPRKVIGRTPEPDHFYDGEEEVISYAIEETPHSERHSFRTTSQLYEGEFLLTDEGALYVYKNGLVGVSQNTAVCHKNEVVCHRNEIVYF
jgi:hypothetical protein